MLWPKRHTPWPFCFPTQMKRRWQGVFRGMSHIKISSLGIKAAGDNSLNKNNLHTIPDPVIKTECYPGDWEMLYKRICESRSCRNSWSIGRQRWHGIILKNTDSHTESGAALSLPAPCDSLTVERGITASGLSRIRLQLTKWKRQN